MTTIITTDTVWSGEVNLTDNVQLAPGATLTIVEGTTVNGGGFQIEVAGHFQSVGTASNDVQFNGVNLNFIQTTSSAQIDIDFTDWNGGNFLTAYSGSLHGSLTLEDSVLTGVNAGGYFFIWSPASEVTLARNVFSESGYFRVYTQEPDVTFVNNVFVNQSGIEIFGYGSEEHAVSVVGNSFLNISDFALEVDLGWKENLAFGIVDNNYFGTLSEEQIEALILDRNDDLNRASFIDLGAIATAPDVNTPNIAPMVMSFIADNSGTEDQIFSFQIASDTFADVDPGDALTYAATLGNGDPLPSWLTFDAATRTFSGTPRNGDVGAITIRVTATDGSNTSVSDTFDIIIGNANDAPVVANAIADQAILEDEVFTFQIAGDAFADVDLGDVLTYAATLANGDPLPSWLSFDAATRTFSGTPRNGDVGAITVRVTATDGSSASVSDTFDITIGNVNDAPTGAATTLTMMEDASHIFGAMDFNFADIEGDAFLGITIDALSGIGNLTLNGVAVIAGQFIASDDLDQLAWTAGDNVNGTGLRAFDFTVKDDGGTENGGGDTSASYAMAFDVTEVVDRFTGTKKKDNLTGTDGNDVLDGKEGNDWLIGGLGDDMLTGGKGTDRFVFRTGDGQDRFKDFNADGKKHDVLDLSELESVSSFRDLKRNHLEQDGKHVVIDGSGGDEIVLINVKIKDLDAGDFVF